MNCDLQNFERLKIIYKKGLEKDFIIGYTFTNQYETDIVYLNKISKNPFNYLIFHILSIIIDDNSFNSNVHFYSFLPYKYVMNEIKKCIMNLSVYKDLKEEYIKSLLFSKIYEIEKNANNILINFNDIDGYPYCQVMNKNKFNDIIYIINKSKEKLAKFLMFFVKLSYEINMKNRMNIISFIEGINEEECEKESSHIIKYISNHYILRDICLYIDVEEYGDNIINESDLDLFEKLPFKFITPM